MTIKNPDIINPIVPSIVLSNKRTSPIDLPIIAANKSQILITNIPKTAIFNGNNRIDKKHPANTYEAPVNFSNSDGLVIGPKKVQYKNLE